MRMIYLMVLSVLLSGCQEKQVQKVVITPTPPMAMAKPSYYAPAKPKEETAIIEMVPDNLRDLPRSTGFYAGSLREQAQKIFSGPGKRSERIKATQAFLNLQTVEWIEINLTTQRMTRWGGGQAIKHNGLSSAVNHLTLPPGVQPKGDKTPHNHEGVFAVITKEPKHWSREFKCWMIRCSFFFEGHAIHDCQPWDRKLIGQAASNGCDRVLPEDNPYSWDSIGTIVFCHD